MAGICTYSVNLSLFHFPVHCCSLPCYLPIGLRSMKAACYFSGVSGPPQCCQMAGCSLCSLAIASLPGIGLQFEATCAYWEDSKLLSFKVPSLSCNIKKPCCSRDCHKESGSGSLMVVMWFHGYDPGRWELKSSRIKKDTGNLIA